MAFAGLRGTGDWATDERPKNFREYILWRNPNGNAPLTALLSRMKTESVNDPEFAWWEEELNPVRLRVTTACTTTQTTVAIDNTGGDCKELVAGDVLLVEKTTSTFSESFANEIVLVASVTDTTNMVITRAQAGTSGATIPDNAWLVKIGNVFEEGTTSPNSSNRNPTKKYNYTQIFKTSYRITNTAKLTKTRTGDPLKNDKKRKMFDHSAALEMAFLLGRRYEDTSGTKPKRYTGGLYFFLADADTNDANSTHCVKTWTTTPTEDNFLDAVYKVWDYQGDSGGANERLVLAGNGFLNSLNKNHPCSKS